MVLSIRFCIAMKPPFGNLRSYAAPHSVWTSPERRLPCYFFDIDDGKHHLRDERGRELADHSAAVTEALDLLKALKDVHDLERRSGGAVINVRDGTGSLIYEGSLSLDDA